MTHSSWRGLCVGGPLDGKFVQHHQRRVEVSERPGFDPIPVSYRGPVEMPKEEIRKVVYELVWLRGVHFWIPEGRTTEWLVEMLAEAYFRLGDLDE